MAACTATVVIGTGPPGVGLKARWLCLWRNSAGWGGPAQRCRLHRNSGERLVALSSHLQIHLLTADTRGRGAATAAALGISLHRLTPGDEAAQKRAFVESLGAERVAAVGNGANLWRNSAAMRRCWPWRPWGSLPVAQQCRVGAGGAGRGHLAKRSTIAPQADLIAPDIGAALDLLLHPQQLIATLRR